MLLFVTAVSVVLVISFMCSIFESVLLSVTRSQIEVIGQERKRTGRMLAGFKENMDVPIAAILILNTAAHTIGAAVAGGGDVVHPAGAAPDRGHGLARLRVGHHALPRLRREAAIPSSSLRHRVRR